MEQSIKARLMGLKGSYIDFVKWIGYDLGITPNQITIGRLILFVPGWLTWIYRHELGQWSDMPWQIFGWLAVILVTTVIIFDLVDGTLARETGQVSEEGKILDPMADKLITYASLGLFWPAIDKLALLLLLSLDLASTFIRGIKVKGANDFGKKKALCQNISKFFFASAVLLALPAMNTIGNVLIWGALIMAFISVGLRIIPLAQK